MPYKNKEDQAKCSKSWYEKNKPLVLERKKKRRDEARKFILDTKQDKSCTMCNVQFPWYKLDYHHRHGTVKRYIISEMPSRNSSITAIEIEIAKCDLTCANCHREHIFNGTKI